MSGEEAVLCMWFEKVGREQVAQKETFAPEVLEKLDRSRAPIIGVLRG
jgi:hypothetical protein